MSIPVFYSEKLNYRLQYFIYHHLDKATRDSQCLRLPSFIAMSTSYLAHLVTRVSGLGELVIRSLGLIFIHSSSDNNRYTWSPVTQVTKQIGDIIAIVPGILGDIIFITGDPRFYVAMHAEGVKVDIAHLQAGTLNTEEHERDSDYAIGIAKKKSIPHQINIKLMFLGRYLLKEDISTIGTTISLSAESSAIDHSPVLVQYIPYYPIISRSDKLNYRVQAYIYNKLDKAIEKTKSLRLPAFLALGTSTLANLILRISSATETTIHGISHLFTAPFSEDWQFHLNTARVLLVEGPYKALEVLLLPLEVIMNSASIIFVPKNFIYQRIEESKINLIHSEQDTIGSIEHKNDLDDAISKTKRRKMNLSN